MEAPVQHHNFFKFLYSTFLKKLLSSSLLLGVLRDSLYRQLGQLTVLQRLHLGSDTEEAVRAFF